LMVPARSQCDPLLYDVDFWMKRRIGVFNTSGMKPELVAEFKAIVRDMLEMADTFRTKVLRESFVGTPFEGLHVGIVCGKSNPTPTGLPASLFDCSVPLDWTSFKMEQGDGRVPFSSATALPEGFSQDVLIFSFKDHGGLLEDSEALLTAIAIIGTPYAASPPSRKDKDKSSSESSSSATTETTTTSTTATTTTATTTESENK